MTEMGRHMRLTLSRPLPVLTSFVQEFKGPVILLSLLVECVKPQAWSSLLGIGTSWTFLRLNRVFLCIAMAYYDLLRSFQEGLSIGFRKSSLSLRFVRAKTV